MKFLGRLLILVCCLGILGATLVFAEVITNPVSQFPVSVDGQFTGGVQGGKIVGEWSDVTPLAFVSPASNEGTLFRTSLDDPNRNSLLYAALAPGTGLPVDALYLMYDYLPRTNPNFGPGEFIADISFPVTIGGVPNKNITVEIRGHVSSPQIAVGQGDGTPSFFDVFVDIQGGENGLLPAVQFGIEAGVGFGPSTLSPANHLLVELEVPLLIPADFGASTGDPVPGTQGSPFPEGGLPGGIYSPDPKFWGSNTANDNIDPMATSAVIGIDPFGTVIANSNFLPVINAAVPEPSTILFLASGILALGVYRWRQGQ